MKNALEILEVEKIENKKELKVAYAKMLKKYHPEDYPEKFIEIQEAYEIILEKLEKSNENYEDFNGFRDYFKNKKNNDNEYKKNKNEEIINESYDEIIFNNYSETVKENNFIKTELINKILNFGRTKKSFTLIGWEGFFEEFKNLDEINKKEIIEILDLNEYDENKNNNKIDEILSHLTKIERHYIVYRLLKNQNKLFEIIENYKSENKKNKNKAIEQFIEKYFYVKRFGLAIIFFLFNINDNKNTFFDTKVNKTFYKIFNSLINNIFLYRIKFDFKRVCYFFDLKNNKFEEDEDIGMLLLGDGATLFLMFISLVMFLDTIYYRKTFSLMKMATQGWYMIVFFRFIQDFVVAKNISRLRKYDITFILIFIISIMNVFLFINLKIYIQLIIIWIIVFSKIFLINYLRYKKIKEISEEILDKIIIFSN